MLPLLVVGGLVVVLGIAALVLDIGHAYVVKRQLQASADAAALAAAGALPSVSSASSVALTYGASGKNPVASTTQTSSGWCLTTVATCYGSSPGTQVGVGGQANGVVVQDVASVPTTFMKVFGIASLTVHATAVACGGCGAQCPATAQSISLRWHYTSGGAGSWSGTQSDDCPASVSMGPQAMEGDLRLSPGSVIQAGYDLSVPGNTSQLTIPVGSPQLVLRARCVSGATPSASQLTIAMPSQTYSVSDSDWYPSGDEHSALVYQGSATVPDLCAGGLVRFDKGGTFTAALPGSSLPVLEPTSAVPGLS